jgi:uncharacterized protein YbjT (DUF2867 family)
MILVTGNIGSRVAREPHDNGVPVRAFARDPARAVAGREPRNFARFARDHAGLFRAGCDGATAFGTQAVEISIQRAEIVAQGMEKP